MRRRVKRGRGGVGRGYRSPVFGWHNPRAVGNRGAGQRRPYADVARRMRSSRKSYAGLDGHGGSKISDALGITHRSTDKRTRGAGFKRGH